MNAKCGSYTSATYGAHYYQECKGCGESHLFAGESLAQSWARRHGRGEGRPLCKCHTKPARSIQEGDTIMHPTRGKMGRVVTVIYTPDPSGFHGQMSGLMIDLGDTGETWAWEYSAGDIVTTRGN